MTRSVTTRPLWDEIGEVQVDNNEALEAEARQYEARKEEANKAAMHKTTMMLRMLGQGIERGIRADALTALIYAFNYDEHYDDE